MKLELYQVDAFADELFSGNPAAVCPLDQWLDEKTMQAIANENNLSETAFFVKTNSGYHLRWFTPTHEVNLCGHATLASAYVIFNYLDKNSDTIQFDSLSGKLEVTKENNLISLNFPSRPPKKIEQNESHNNLLNHEPVEIYFHTKTLFLLKDEEEVRSAQPNFSKIAQLKSDGLIITAPGENYNFVSRYFAPHVGIPEDPVTGAAHTVLTPFWSSRLKKKKLTGFQLSERGGKVICEDLGERVKLSGNAVLYSRGEIYI